MIELRGVSKTVRSGSEALTILHPLDLKVPGGQFWSIVGPSGSGKSTLLGLIAGLDAPSSGQILVDEVNAWTGTAVISMEFLGPRSPEKIAQIRGCFPDTEVEAVLTCRDLARNIPAMWLESMLLSMH